MRNHLSGFRGLLLGTLLCSCTTNQENIQTIASRPTSKMFSGFTPNPGETIRVQILWTKSKKRDDPTAFWSTLATTVSGTTPAATSGGVNYFAWSVTVPVPKTGSALWSSNTVARLRVAHGNGSPPTLGYSFDDTGCIFDQPGEVWRDRAIRCASEFGNGYFHFVDPGSRSITDVQFLTRYQTGAPDDTAPAEDYYDRIDPTGAKTTLADWQDENGFNALSGYDPEVNTRYYNAGDLELGRDMHCRKKTGSAEFACYVTNYGNPALATPRVQDSNRAAALDAAVSRDVDGLVATVAMEYRGSIGDNAVTFYFFDENGDRADKALLDRQGAKAVPGMCMSCHGGTYDAATDSVRDARFLPFDLDNFEYSTTSGFTRQAQQQAFRDLNELVYASNSTPATQELIEGWYGSPPNFGLNGPDQNAAFVPTGWSGHEVLYRQVVKPYCRSCHVALFDGSDSRAFTSFTDFSGLERAIESAVCSNGMDMPHAQVTWQNFFEGPARGYLIGGLNLGTDCGPR